MSTVNLGQVSPGAATAAQSPQGNFVVCVVSDAYWQLSVAPDVAATSRGEADVAISTDGVTWKSVDSAPVAVGSGTATGSEGVMLAVSLRVRPDFGTRIGRHELPLILLMNGQRLQAAPLRVAYDVLPTVSLEQDGDRFTIAADKPSERREYDSNTRTYVVRSNAAWNLEVWQNSSEERPFRVEVMDVAGKYKTVRQPVIVASSGPTGDSGTAVSLRLRLTLQDATVGGVYATDLNVKARLVGEAGTNTFGPASSIVR